VLGTLDDVRWAAREAAVMVPNLRAVVAPHIPSGIVPIFAGLGILALSADASALKTLQSSPSVGLPAPDAGNGKDIIQISAGSASLELKWLAVGEERGWTTGAAMSESAA
jgi:hypothetical protein